MTIRTTHSLSIHLKTHVHRPVKSLSDGLAQPVTLGEKEGSGAISHLERWIPCDSD